MNTLLVRKIGYTYATTSVLTYVHYNYTDAKIAIEKNRYNLTDFVHRTNRYDYAHEWEYVYENINYGSNFINALFFPLTIFQRVIPTLAIYRNPN